MLNRYNTEEINAEVKHDAATLLFLVPYCLRVVLGFCNCFADDSL
jgi:hypothetical protein